MVCHLSNACARIVCFVCHKLFCMVSSPFPANQLTCCLKLFASFSFYFDAIWTDLHNFLSFFVSIHWVSAVFLFSVLSCFMHCFVVLILSSFVFYFHSNSELPFHVEKFFMLKKSLMLKKPPQIKLPVCFHLLCAFSVFELVACYFCCLVCRSMQHLGLFGIHCFLITLPFPKI